MPETQDPESQTTPQLPQLLGSVLLSTHLEAQQLSMLAEPEHALKQVPQLRGLLVRSTHSVPHGLKPAPHSGPDPESRTSAVPVSAAGVPVSSYVIDPS
jgi:hypothetical protein